MCHNQKQVICLGILTSLEKWCFSKSCIKKYLTSSEQLYENKNVPNLLPKDQQMCTEYQEPLLATVKWNKLVWFGMWWHNTWLSGHLGRWLTPRKKLAGKHNGLTISHSTCLRSFKTSLNRNLVSCWVYDVSLSDQCWLSLVVKGQMNECFYRSISQM